MIILSIDLIPTGPKFKQTNNNRNKKSSSAVGKRTKKLQATKSEQNLIHLSTSSSAHHPGMMKSNSEWVLAPQGHQPFQTQNQDLFIGRMHPSQSLPDFLSQPHPIQFHQIPSVPNQHYYSSPNAPQAFTEQRLATVQRGKILQSKFESYDISSQEFLCYLII